MAYDAKTERLISIKKLSGKAQTSNLKGLIGETKPSGLTVSFETVFGEPIPTTPAPNTDALYTILGTGDGQVEYLRFPTTFIPGTVDDDGGRSGFQLALPATYEDDSSNPNKGTYPYINGQTINITSGSLQLLPPSFAVGYEARPFYGGTTSKDSGDRIYLTDIRDWYLDYFNGVFFQQDPPGAGDDPANPTFVQGYLYIGKYLSETSGGGGTPGGSDTEVQFNDGGDEFGGDSTFTFNKTTNTLTVPNLSGSLTRLTDGTSYLIAGNHIAISTGSSGAVTVNAFRAPGSIGRTKATYEVTSVISAGTTFNASSNNFNDSGFASDLIDVFTNGQLLLSGTLPEVNLGDADYSLTGDATLKFSFVLLSFDIISIISFTSGSDLPSSKYTMIFNEIPSGIIDGSNTVFNISAVPSPSDTSCMVYLNGQLLTLNSDYTISNTAITLSVTPFLDDILTVTYQKDTP